MAGDDSTATVQEIQSLLSLFRDVARTSATGFKGRFKKDCTRHSRRVASLSHLLEKFRDFQGDQFPLHMACSSFHISANGGSQSYYKVASICKPLRSHYFIRKFIDSGLEFEERAALEITSQFLCVTCKLETSLGYFPTGDFEISEEIKEHVDLLRVYLKLAEQGYSDAVEKPMIPNDFFCPISLEVFTDPVIVSTGQTYERSYIQRWIKSGKTTCPKTQQQLTNPTLIPNYVLRSLIADWCTDHRKPKKLENTVGAKTRASLSKNKGQPSQKYHLYQKEA